MPWYENSDILWFLLGVMSYLAGRFWWEVRRLKKLMRDVAAGRATLSAKSPSDVIKRM